mgnify:CR=1 FL=1
MNYRLLKTILLSALLSFSVLTMAEAAVPLVNINTATAEELASAVSGVGLKKAARIVAYRKSKGEFHNVSELANVKGIGVNIIEKNLAILRIE